MNQIVGNYMLYSTNMVGIFQFFDNIKIIPKKLPEHVLGHDTAQHRRPAAVAAVGMPHKQTFENLAQDLVEQHTKYFELILSLVPGLLIKSQQLI